MPVTSGSITANGITTPQNTPITWDDFNSQYTPAQQQQLLSSMGLTPDETSQLLDTLQKTEISQYKQYQADQAYQRSIKPFHEGEGWFQPVQSGLDFLFGRWNPVGNAVINTALGAANAITGMGPDDKSTADLQKQSGLTDLLKKLTAASVLNQVANQQQQAGAVLPGYSTQNLNAYTQNYLIPAMQANNKIMQQDMQDWGNYVKTMPGASSPIGQILQQEYKNQAPLYDKLAFDNWSQVLTPNYVQALNQAIGAQVAGGARGLTEYGTIGTILANAQNAGPGGLPATPATSLAGGANPLNLAALGLTNYTPPTSQSINTQPGGP